MANRKACPLLVQSDTSPSLTIQGEAYTRVYFLECLGEKCAAFSTQDCFCEKFQHTVKAAQRKEGQDAKSAHSAARDITTL